MKKPLLTILTIIGLASHAMSQTGSIGIGTTSPAPSAKLEINTTTSGFLMPRLTEIQRDAINAPANGLLIFNVDEQCPNLYDSVAGDWQRMNCDPVQTGVAVVDCSQSTVQGSYIQGTVLNSADNTITLTVNVTTAGTYNVAAVSTGMVFTASGTFASTGIQTLVLEGNGTPTSAGGSLVIISINGGDPCNVVINVVSSVANLAGCGTPSNAVTPAGGLKAGVSTPASTTTAINSISYTGGALYTMNAVSVNGVSLIRPTSGSFGTSPASLTMDLDGTPVAPGLTTIPFGINNQPTCSLTVPVTSGTGRVTTLNCTGALAGSFVANVPLTSSETKTITANVPLAGGPGTFYLRTNTVNGYYFATPTPVTLGAGSPTVVLVGYGTPVATGVNTFTVTASTSTTAFTTCSFDVTVLSGTAPPPPTTNVCTSSTQASGYTSTINGHSVTITRTISGGTPNGAQADVNCGVTIGSGNYLGNLMAISGSNNFMTITYSFSRPVSNIQFSHMNISTNESLTYATSLSGTSVTPTVALSSVQGVCNGYYTISGTTTKTVKLTTANQTYKGNVVVVSGVWYDKVTVTYNKGANSTISMAVMLCNATSL